MRHVARGILLASFTLCAVGGPQRAVGDTVSFAYEATDTFPWQAGFLGPGACSFSCVESLQDGHYVADVDPGLGAGSYNFHRWIAMPGEAPPPTLWVEWRFRSNFSYLESDGFVLDDARVFVEYDQTGQATWMWGDAVFDNSVCCAVTGLAMGEFHAYRYEVRDDSGSRRWADGRLLMENLFGFFGGGNTYIQFGGSGGGGGGPYYDLTDEWDYVRYGLITFGEVVIASDPPTGYIDPRQDRPVGSPQTLQGLDRFTVTFNEPNGLYIDNIAVESTAPTALRPTVQWVTRPEGDDGDTWEIRLDKRIPPGHRTRFIISDEAEAAAVGQQGAASVIEYAFLPGDVNGDGTSNTQDLLALIVGLNTCISAGDCSSAASLSHYDINRSDSVNTQDLLRVIQLLNGTQTQQSWNGVSLPAWP